MECTVPVLVVTLGPGAQFTVVITKQIEKGCGFTPFSFLALRLIGFFNHIFFMVKVAA